MHCSHFLIYTPITSSHALLLNHHKHWYYFITSYFSTCTALTSSHALLLLPHIHFSYFTHPSKPSFQKVVGSCGARPSELDSVVTASRSSSYSWLRVCSANSWAQLGSNHLTPILLKPKTKILASVREQGGRRISALSECVLLNRLTSAKPAPISLLKSQSFPETLVRP